MLWLTWNILHPIAYRHKNNNNNNNNNKYDYTMLNRAAVSWTEDVTLVALHKTVHNVCATTISHWKQRVSNENLTRYIRRLYTVTGNICTTAAVDIRRANVCAEVLDHTVTSRHWLLPTSAQQPTNAHGSGRHHQIIIYHRFVCLCHHQKGGRCIIVFGLSVR